MSSYFFVKSIVAGSKADDVKNIVVRADDADAAVREVSSRANVIGVVSVRDAKSQRDCRCQSHTQHNATPTQVDYTPPPKNI